MSSGIDDNLSKPYQITELTAMLDKWSPKGIKPKSSTGPVQKSKLLDRTVSTHIPMHTYLNQAPDASGSICFEPRHEC